MREEVRLLIRICRSFIGFIHQNGGLTDEECEAVLYCARDLENELAPYCPRPKSFG